MPALESALHRPQTRTTTPSFTMPPPFWKASLQIIGSSTEPACLAFGHTLSQSQDENLIGVAQSFQRVYVPLHARTDARL